MALKKIVKNIIGERLIWKTKQLLEGFSPTEQELISKRKLFYKKFINKNDLCFDVGANIGNRITPLLQIGAKVIAVEPQETCYKVLEYKFDKKITIITKGLSDKAGIKKFHISKTNTISSFSDEWINSVKTDRFKEYSWDTTIDVEMTTLDNLIDQYGLPAFIKIDVEGYELEVLKGLTKPVKMISFEYTVPEQTHKIFDCINLVRENNPTILCNYSIGESMEWEMENWLTVDDFFRYINESNFVNTDFGDIYLKQGSN
ncbi:hypothetical protein GCM10028805_11550 [Spirosoma harenae]